MSILKHKQRREFNISRKEDLELFKDYLGTNKWGEDGCPFVVEWPWNNAVDMIKHKITKEYLESI